MRRGLLHGFPCGDPLTRFLSTAQGIVGRRCEPLRQDREGFLARPTDPAPNPEAFVLVVMTLAEPAPVADDRVVLTDWTSPRQEGQWDHPGLDVVFHLWQCDKKNHGWREGRR